MKPPYSPGAAGSGSSSAARRDLSRLAVPAAPPRKERNKVTIEAYYMGCWERIGHHLWRPGMSQVRYGDQVPLPWGYGGLDSDAFNTADFHIEKRDGWTAVGLEDRSVDKRPHSHSVFAFHADLTLDEAVALARQTFPEVFARPGFPAPVPSSVAADTTP